MANFFDILLGSAAIVQFFLVILLIFAVVFPLWMLVDCITRENVSSKALWILIIVVGNVVGALLYIFFERNKKHHV